MAETTPIRATQPVTLLAHCGSCLEAIRAVYEPVYIVSVRTPFLCPHCGSENSFTVPGHVRNVERWPGTRKP